MTDGRHGVPPAALAGAAAGPGAAAAAAPASPCVAICHLDPVRRFCEGCGRTGREIARWGTADAPEKRAIAAAARARLGRAG